MLAAANAAKSFTTEYILRFHKSGIGILDFEQIASLENYTYLWGIEGDGWLNEWKMDPDGFSANEELSESAAIKLNELNNLRLKAIKPLEDLKQNFSGNTQNMARALVKLLDNCGAAESFKNFSKNYTQNTLYGDAVRQSWNSLMKTLNIIVVCFGEATITKQEY